MSARFMVTNDGNLDLTCGAKFLARNLDGSWSWTANPKGAWRFEDEANAQGMALTCDSPTAAVIPAMVQNADGEWVDGEWPAGGSQ